MSTLSRRRFVTDLAIAGAGLTIVPRHVLGRGFTAPSDLLNVAAVGVGGQGRANLINLASQNVVAMCDVDWEYAGKAFDALDTDIKNQQERLDRTTPRLDAQGRPEAPLTATERERMRRTGEQLRWRVDGTWEFVQRAEAPDAPDGPVLGVGRGPASPREEILCELFAEVLGVDRVGVADSFFDLGGHSLLAAVLMAKVTERFDVEVPLRRFLSEPTVAAVSAQLG
jgi:acyl carrier protein